MDTENFVTDNNQNVKIAAWLFNRTSNDNFPDTMGCLFLFIVNSYKHSILLVMYEGHLKE